MLDIPSSNASRSGRYQLPDEAATYVRELVVSGSVSPGDFLRLEPIAEAIGASITPVREGLRILQNEGFVRLVPRRGFMVEEISKQDIHDLFWSQAMLAGELAARAAEKISDSKIKELRENTEAYERALQLGDTDGMGKIGSTFHATINQAADSPRLTNLLGSVSNQLPRRFYASIKGGGAATRDEHPQIVEHLSQRDAASTGAAMQSHILTKSHRLVAALEQRGFWRNQSVEGPPNETAGVKP